MTTERYIVVNVTSHTVAAYGRDSGDILIVLILSERTRPNIYFRYSYSSEQNESNLKELSRL